MTKKGYFPYWMKEPLPQEDRVKFLDRKTVLERLRNGEKIRFNPDPWMKVAPKIYFEKDNRLLAIRRNTFESLKSSELIKWNNPTKFSNQRIEIWSLTT